MQLKKMAVAIGLVGLSPALFAQSSVEIYGIADVGVEYLNHVPQVGGGTGSQFLLSSGNVQSSRIGFRGTENLGGGLAAIFALENGFALDNGTLSNGGRLFGRQAWVGLKNANNTLQIGRTNNMIYDFGVAFDPYSGMHYSATTYDAAYAGRADNSLKYLGTFGAFNVRGQYSFGYDGVRGIGEAPGAFKAGKEMGVYATYDIANYRIGAAYDRQNGGTVATQDDKDTRYSIGVTATFKPVKLYAAYERRTVDVGVTSTRRDLAWVGAMYSATPAVTVGANVYWLDPDGGDNRSSMLALFGSYALSKRTDLYSALALARNQSLATIGASGVVNSGDNQSGLVVGVRHLF